jgi:molybdenum cofactor cytidylyltransferase
VRIGAVVPAAGWSRRMGREKVLLPFGRSTMLETVVGKLREAGADRIIAVLRPDLSEAERRARAAGADVVINPHPEEEMLVSIRLGIERLDPNLDAFFVWPADHPAVAATTLAALVEHASRSTVVIPTHLGRRGHPAIVGIDLVADVARVPAHEGLRQLWRARADAVSELPVDDPGVLENLDDPESYEAALLRDSVASEGKGVRPKSE